MTLEPAAYWKLRALVAAASQRFAEGQLREEQAQRCFSDAGAQTRGAFQAVGLEVSPTTRVVFDDKAFTVTIGESDAKDT